MWSCFESLFYISELFTVSVHKWPLRRKGVVGLRRPIRWHILEYRFTIVYFFAVCDCSLRNAGLGKCYFKRDSTIARV